jgi:hypothetical protein
MTDIFISLEAVLRQMAMNDGEEMRRGDVGNCHHVN